MIALWRYSILLKTKITDWRSGLITAISVILSICFIMGISYNCILYNFSLDVEIEQYDAHIALFVDNTFVRVEQRHPYYRYKENWLLMRKLSENELNDAIMKYGDPDNYYVK